MVTSIALISTVAVSCTEIGPNQAGFTVQSASLEGTKLDLVHETIDPNNSA